MTSSRRDFLKTAGVAFGALTLSGWAFELEAEFAAFAEVNKNKLSYSALSLAKKVVAT